MTQNSRKMTTKYEVTDYEDKVVEQCLNKLRKEMRNTKGNQEEFRIAKNKIGCFRIHLLKLFSLAFKEGVYVGKPK